MKKVTTQKPHIGFIGQGFIGKNMADDFVRRKYKVVRFALEAPHKDNREAIAECDIVFIAVPTPTTPEGFCDRALRAALPLVGKGKIAVIKSTILPGKTRELQEEFPHCIVLHAPEFLREKKASFDTQRPQRNIVGIPKQTKRYKEAGERVLRVLPKASYEIVCTSDEAELIKYGGNCYLASRVVFMNTLYDLAQTVGARYEVITGAMAADPRIGGSHMNIIDSSGHHNARPGRGAGGHCFPKDLGALRMFAEEKLGNDAPGTQILKALEATNVHLLCSTQKDIDLLIEIYGEFALRQCAAGGKVKGKKAKSKKAN